jgi:hypothetical protein
MPKTFTPKVETIEGRLAIRSRAGVILYLDDFDDLASAKKAAYDQAPHWSHDDDDDDDDESR